LSRRGIAYRASREFRDGQVVNLGTGIPSLCADFVADRGEVLLHSEQGLLGFGRRAKSKQEIDPFLLNAGRQPVTPKAGMCLMDHAESFALIRGGRIDVTVLGALQVSGDGDLANCWLPGAAAGSLGGAQDLAFRARKVVAALPFLSHPPRLVRTLNLELTAPRCVDCVISDVAVVDLVGGSVVVRELALGWTLEDVQELVEPVLEVPPGGPSVLQVPEDDSGMWMEVGIR